MSAWSKEETQTKVKTRRRDQAIDGLVLSPNRLRLLVASACTLMLVSFVVEGLWLERLPEGWQSLARAGFVAGVTVAVFIELARRARRRLRALEKQQAALRESEARLAHALQIGGLGTWEGDLRSGRIAWSAITELMHGLEPGTFLGTFEAFLACVHPEDRSRVRREVAADENASEIRREYRTLLSNGTVLCVLNRGRVYRDEAGQPTRVLGICQDITERMQAEEQRKLLQRGEKLRALGQLASGVAHDLNQQFSLVSGYGQLAQKALAESGREIPEVADSLRVITRAALDGGETVKRLLTFTRGRVEGEPEAIDVAALLRDVAELAAPRWRDEAQALGHPIALDVDAAPGLIVEGWAHALRDAITNLIFNAIDAMPHGGAIRVTARSADGRVIVEVTDSGTGMSPEVQMRLFEPFFTTKGDKGTGLGLAGVYGIVQRHGGQIDVESEPDRGSTFRVSLPLAGQLRAAAPALPAVVTRRLRILAVEDEPELRRMVTRILEVLGHTVVGAGTGEEALAILAGAETFDVLLSDLGLGAGMNGWELVARVATQWPSVKAILVTGWGAEIDAVQAAARGIRDVVAKPYSVQDLERVLAAA